MKKYLLFLLISLAAGVSTLQIHALPISTCPESCTSSCGNCKVVKTFCVDPCECIVNSRTHFTDRPLFYINSPEHDSLWMDRVLADEDNRQSAFQAVLFGSKTTERGRMATYFTPFCANQLLVKEDMTGVTDAIGAKYFNVQTVNGDFESIIRFAPEQSVIGLGLDFKTRFAQSCNGRAFLFEILMPIMRVRNTMNFSEQVINDGGGAIIDPDATAAGVVANMQQAFKQPIWECGKIDCCCDMTKTRIGDIEVTLGYELAQGTYCRVAGYAGVSIPTGNSVKSTYLYQPVVGHGKHTGFMIGTTAEVDLWSNECGNESLWYYFHMNGLYLMRKHEQRLVDVVNKPWSRFMRVYKNKAQAQEALDTSDIFLYTPGVNVFCRQMEVRPGFQRTYTNSFVYMRNGFTGEFGYTFFCRPAECVRLACPWEEEAAFVAYNSIPGATDNVQMINNIFDTNGIDRNARPVAEYDDNIIKACDLDLQSATHPEVISHTFYFSLAYRWDECDHPVFIGVGGSFEDCPDNSGASRWTAWAKGGVSW